MGPLMRRLRKLMIRPVAGALMLAVAVVSSGECLRAAQMTPDQHACCVAMKGECEMAITASCCGTEASESLGVIATKATVDLVPVSVLVAVLSLPAVAESLDSHIAAAPEASSSGPPGVPTYLFVSSFRI